MLRPFKFVAGCGDRLFIAPTYTFETPALGGQLAVGVTGIVGNLDTSIAGTLTAQVGPIVATRNGFLSDSFTGVGDLYPMVTLKWNQGVHNYMRRRRKMLDVGEPAPPI